MKDSGVEWLGEIPVGWEVIKLKFEDSTNMGQSPDSENCNMNEIGLPFLQGNAEFGDFHPTPKLWCTKPKKIGKKGDILLSIRAPVGELNIADRVFGIGRGLVAITPKKSNISFKLYQLKASTVFLKSLSTGSTFDAVSGGDINNLFLPIPPLSEQTAIATFLDQKTAQIDQAIALKQKQIELFKERKQLVIQRAVTKGLDPHAPMRDSGVEWIGEIPDHWELRRLKYVLDERNERSKKGEEPLFMVSQIHGLVVRSEYHAKAEVAQSTIDNKIVHKNDLVFNKLKAHLGVFFKSNIEFNGIVSPDYAVYKPKAFIDDLKYLEYLFRHPAYIEQFIIKATGIVEGLIRLYTTALFEIPIPIPSLIEQKNILSFIETQSAKIVKAIDIQQQQINKLKEYKATLINSAVTGKIKVF